MAFDAQFVDGFDKYGPLDRVVVIDDMGGEWTTFVNNVGTATMTVRNALVATGNALALAVSGTFLGAAVAALNKTLSGTYARWIGGRTWQAALADPQGWRCRDGTTDQLTILVNTIGKIEVRRGSTTGTLLATSSESVSDGSVNVIEWDVTIHPSAGIFKVWLNGTLTSLNATGQNTRATSNSSFDGISEVVTNNTNSSSAITRTLVVDHAYNWFFTASGGSETPCLTNPIVETQFPTSDNSVQFASGTGVLGHAYRITTTTSAPGANRLELREWTAQVNMTLNSVAIVPVATSATAKFKAVLYSAAGALVATGTEVVGCTSGSQLTLPFASGQSLTGGTLYKIGFITDTSIAIQQEDTGTLGQGAANTYTSGAPASPTLTTNRPTWQIWGNCTSLASNYAAVDENPPLGALSYVTSSTVGHQDLYGFPAMTDNPQTIYNVTVKANLAKTGIAPSTSFGFVGSRYDTDPNTGLAWTKSGLDAALSGFKIAS